ncbi:hypothetical protein G6F30_014269 [Rhizopus arrhizus]|uniref:Uncharacterized protein n=1 Tax=Rhizopus oryzae TaxID=64495 RepID=A0A9P6WSZ4_RHIOR|nr:hypothetical protein G6F32_016344 [Rhizopus arrhizus]KAG0921113.1 hypothetical protein G6F30_014269 [Rhizopus arrhizus]KAG1079543.1 hypothetical protein G6F39_014259 [Rhizopus arrhizus]KAG1277996.1 hypothetical protein G6F64_014682 [Rhizopus arrhizus]
MKFANDLAFLLNHQPIFPAKLDTLRNAVGIDYTYKGMFRLVVCPECHTLYQPEEVHCDSKCTFSEFRITCNTPLFKPVTIGASKMYANKVSAFNSICCIMVKVIKEKVETKIKKQFEYFLRLIFISV